MTKMLTSEEIRQMFLDFFKDQGHTVVPSASLVPSNDPTLLFVNAGMVPFKDIFLGLEKASYSRAASVQRCMRVSGKHNDLENVGPSPRHHTFFEMLGNFSFGDYFKREAIAFAYNLLTKGYGFDPALLYYTVHTTDQEAYDIWSKEMGIPEEKIFWMEGNFWRMADVGPCGPNAEIIYDRGPELCSCGDPNCSIPLDNGCDRWLEIWNLVFMQYSQEASGAMNPLPRPGVDTGMGFERIVAIIQNQPHNYGTDLFQPIFARIQALLGHSDEQAAENYVGYRVIADHARAATFLISDGVLPGNEGRNYVLRLILRRALRYGKKIGFEGPFIADVAAAVIDKMGSHYTELKGRRDFILAAVAKEEAAFDVTLGRGLALLDDLVARVQKQSKNVLPGEEVFQLYSTYGFPYDLIKDIARERGFEIDQRGYDQAMAEQKARSKAGSAFSVDKWVEHYRRLSAELPATQFVGYDYGQLEQFSTTVLAIIDPETGERLPEAATGREVDLILTSSPFYAEGGGQVGDTGIVETEYGRALIADVQKPIPNVHVHRAEIVSGTIRSGETARASVDVQRRWAIMRNHTATHLLHRALRGQLGDHAQQRGSLVAPDYLRFDFNHLNKIGEAELEAIEREVNAHIRADMPVCPQELALDEARQQGAMMLFGEKYGDRVRMVGVEDYSKELCGGTHVLQTGQIGPFVITSEQSISQGVRRIVALTGEGAEQYLYRQRQLVQQVARQIGVNSEDAIKERLDAMQEQIKGLNRQLVAVQRQQLQQQVEAALPTAREVGGVKVLATQVEAASSELVGELMERLRGQLGSAVVALGAVINQKPLLMVGVTPDVVARGGHAGKLVQQGAKIIGGNGGGRPEFAQGGGSDPARVPEALARIGELVEEQLAGK